MENYIVSARKYRPLTFEDVVGQGAITTTLQKAIKNNHLAQALLFCGPRGVGKTTCARILAKAINQDGNTNPDEDFSFNIFELDAASNNSVDDIRSLIDQVRFAPQQGKFKVYIIDEVHMLSSQAFNAFLKTLEEPPAHAIFILATTEKHKIIPTILSRCQIFDFRRIQISDMVAHLANIATKEGVKAEEEALHVIAEKADGALRDALSIFDRVVTFAGNELTYKDAIENLNILDHDYYFRAMDMILQGDMSGSMLLFSEVLEAGFSGHEFINGLATHARDLMMCMDASTVSLLQVSDRIRQRFLEQAKQASPLNMLKCLRAMNDCDVQYRASKNQRLLVELALMRMCALHKTPEGPDRPVEKKKPLTEQPAAVTTATSEPKPPPEPTPKSSDTEPTSAESTAPKATDRNNSETSSAKENVRSESKAADRPQAVPQASETEATNYGPRKSVQLKVKRLGRGKGSVRISDANKKKEEDQNKDLNLPSDHFTEEQLHDIWQKRVHLMFREKPGILSSLTKNKPKLKEGHTIELPLDGRHQIEQLADSRSTLLDALRKELNNFSIELETPISTLPDTGKKPYTPKEIYEKMVQENPHVEALRKALDLDLDL